MNPASSHLATRRAQGGVVYKWKVFTGGRMGKRAINRNKRKDNIWVEASFLWGKRPGRIFIMQIISSFYGRQRGIT